MTKRLSYSIALTTILTLVIEGDSRQLLLRLNPECPQHQCADGVNIAYIEAKGDTDSVHYLWSSVKCIPPSLLIAKSDLKTKVSVDWSSLSKYIETNCTQKEVLRNFIKIEGTVSNSIDFQIRRFFFFSDSKKTGSYDPSDDTLEIDWDSSEGFVWNDTKVIKNGSDSIELRFTNRKNETAVVNGIVTFDLRVDASDGRTDDLPQLAFTDSSASLQMTVNNVTTNSTLFPNPRLMAVIDISANRPVSDPKFDEITKIDDEYSPGVFKVCQLSSFNHWIRLMIRLFDSKSY